ncbi:hypothetical protein DVS28_a3567 [Euzebya pacifica]|uniref:Uncharacterized protein n=1 Tax=Euzebya pacifica TaxID=1608957 RepID=A0A346Y193_9ACTN|nr:hypothetical protein [Euzebya pacifica]AXV08240.1 hypothetical protein DVS28_a3567 [Euzebya pacifica]
MSERTQQTAVVVALVAVVGAVGAVSWLGGRMAEPAGPPVASVEEVVEPSVEPTVSPSSSVSASASEAEPSESPSASESESEAAVEAVEAVPEGQTVLFRGGPADGPWRTIGSVAEITHPDAAPGSTYPYVNFWSDPEEENQPDWLWDQITAEVAEQAVTLGEPVDRPTFGGAELSEGFNAFGGIEDIYFDDEVFTAIWKAIYEDVDGVAAAHWVYVIDFEAKILHRRGPMIIREDEVADFNERSQRAVAWAREVASELGYNL